MKHGCEPAAHPEGTPLAYGANMMRAPLTLLALTTLPAGTVSPRGDDYGSTHAHRFQQPPQAAAHCFARNAEEHSSALMSKVTTTRDGGAHVLVQVKNGVTYATADFRRAGNASVASIALMVTGSVGRDDIVGSLVNGC